MTEQVVDWDMVLGEIKKIYDSVEKLAQQFAGRPFTPDGHLVGSIGEVVASYAFGLTLEKPSNQGADAIHRKSGRSVEVKCTQTKRVSFYDCAPTNNVIVLFIDRDGSFECVFNGLFADLERGLVAANLWRRRSGRNDGDRVLFDDGVPQRFRVVTFVAEDMPGR